MAEFAATPVNAGHPYIMAPAIQASVADQYRKKSTISILANTPQLQAVQHQQVNIVEGVFYQPGNLKLSEKINCYRQQPLHDND